jgi:uncharacterized protein (DUF4415 family)
MSQTKTDKKFILEITEEDYQEGLAKGWTDDDMLPVGKHEFRRATRFRDKPEEVNVKLEADVVGFLKKHPQESYEKQINSAVRKLMKQELESV